MTEDYVEFHARSAFSFLEGASLPEALVEQAAKLGMSALGILDRDGLYGAPRLYTTAKKLGLRSHVGAEVSVSDLGLQVQPAEWQPHTIPQRPIRLSLLCESQTGYRNLSQLITGYKLRQKTKGEGVAMLHEVKERSDGLVCLTGGDEGPLAAALERGGMDEGRRVLRLLVQTFGPNNVYVELQRHRIREQEARNDAALSLSREFHLPVLATNGVNMATAFEREVLDVLTTTARFQWRHGTVSTTLKAAIRAVNQGGNLIPRARYQFGSLTRKKRAKGSDAWEFRYYESTEDGSRRRKTATVGSVEKYGTKALAQRAVEALLLKLNSETPQQSMAVVTFGAICDRYLEEELPERYSTAKSYRSNIKNYLRPRWGDYLLEKVRPMAVEDWFKNLSMAPKSKAHIRSVMHLMFECATRWELFNERRNPIALVRVKGGSKRRQRPTSLTVEEFELIVATLKEPWRTMVQIAQCLGLRVSEIAALQWDDFDFDKNQLLVQRSFVNGRVDDVKTEYSQDYVPLHPSLTEIVLKWSTHAVPTEEGWVFANPRTSRPYYPTEIQKRHLRPSGCCVVECPTCGAASGVWCNQDQKTGNGVRMLLHETRVKNSGKYGTIGWHTFRHTYRSWLDETGAPMKVQQELMRHASIQTTMNVYGQAMSSSKREANGKVVEMVLKPLRASA